MVEGETRTGFKFSYKRKVLESMRVVEALANLERGEGKSIIGLSDLLSLMLGEEQKEQLYEHLESLDDEGYASMDALKDELEDMFNASGDQGKN
ncbi:MAG: hypothetical protein LUD72_04000 [Bacteroidales bacterium]|nr:hypothetical protein [Bacteroidales bacterium]